MFEPYVKLMNFSCVIDRYARFLTFLVYSERSLSTDRPCDFALAFPKNVSPGDLATTTPAKIGYLSVCRDESENVPDEPLWHRPRPQEFDRDSRFLSSAHCSTESRIIANM